MFLKYMTVIYYMSIDRADKPWIGDRRLTEESFPSRYVLRTAVGFCTRVTYIRGTTGS